MGFKSHQDDIPILEELFQLHGPCLHLYVHLNSPIPQPLEVIEWICIQLAQQDGRERQRMQLHGKATLQVSVFEESFLEDTNISCSLCLGGNILVTALFFPL